MAGDAKSPLSTCMALFFSLLLVYSHFTMAVLIEHGFSPLTSNKDGANKRNNMVAASSRSEGSTQSSKRDMAVKEENGKGLQLQGTKRGRAPRPPLQWQKRFFSANEHEVPSGPNPISNK